MIPLRISYSKLIASFFPSLITIGVAYFSYPDCWHSFFILSTRALDASIVELLVVIPGFIVANLLSWTEFSIVWDSKVAVEYLSGNTLIRDIYSSHCTFCRELPSRNL